MLTKDDLKEVKFALDDRIPDGEMEKLTEAIDLFKALKRHQLLGPDKLDVLRECLEVLNSPKLVEMLDNFADVGTKFSLKSRSEDRLEIDSQSVSVKGSRNFETSGENVDVFSVRVTRNQSNNWTVTIEMPDLVLKGLVIAVLMIKIIQCI